MRFHFGLSFRPKQLLKWLIPILVALGLISFSDLKFVHASSDSQTDIHIDTTDISVARLCGRSIKEYTTYFMENLSDLYNLVVSYEYNNNNSGVTNYRFTFVPKIFNQINYYIYKPDYSNDNTLDNVSITLARFSNEHLSQNDYQQLRSNSFTLTLSDSYCSGKTDLLDSPMALADLSNYMTFYQDFITNYNTLKINIDNTNFYLENSNTNLYINYDSDYDLYYEFDYNNRYQSYMVYSNIPVIYNNVEPLWYEFFNSSSMEVLPVYYNDDLLDNNDEVDFDYIFQPDFPVTYTKFDNFYINVEASELNNIDFNLYFHNSNIVDFVTSMDPYYSNFYGRVPHNEGYYTYEKLNCTIGSDRNYEFNRESNNAVFYFRNISCQEQLTPYDRVYFHLSFYNGANSNIDESVSNVKVTTRNGVVYHTNIDKDIYEKFDNLYRESKIFISAYDLDSQKYLYIKSSSNFIFYQYYDEMNWKPISSINGVIDNGLMRYNDFEPVQYYGQGNGLFFYNQARMNQDNFSIDLLFDYDSLLSINQHGNTMYYYYDKHIYSNDIVIDYKDTDIPVNDYDTSYYFSIISNYIDSISSDLVEFSKITQDVYDTMPPVVSSIFFVLFILGNIFIILKLIRR